MLYRPFVHKVHKGGLEDILRDQRLVSTEARAVAGATSQVRAVKGSFETYKEKMFGPNALDPSEKFIEFMTAKAPRANSGPTWAHFDVPEGDFLPIKVVAVYNGLGLKIR